MYPLIHSTMLRIPLLPIPYASLLTSLSIRLNFKKLIFNCHRHESQLSLKSIFSLCFSFHTSNLFRILLTAILFCIDIYTFFNPSILPFDGASHSHAGYLFWQTTKPTSPNSTLHGFSTFHSFHTLTLSAIQYSTNYVLPCFPHSLFTHIQLLFITPYHYSIINQFKAPKYTHHQIPL